jgi:hypothetical protein
VRVLALADDAVDAGAAFGVALADNMTLQIAAMGAKRAVSAGFRRVFNDMHVILPNLLFSLFC